MAVYGLGTPGQVPWTGYSNTLGAGDANKEAQSGYIAFNGITQRDEFLAKAFRNGAGSMALKALWVALTGTAVGSNATATYKRVSGMIADNNYGGVRPIETVTVVNRNTTAADDTAITALLNRNVFPSTYVADLSGNGGGGKLGY